MHIITQILEGCIQVHVLFPLKDDFSLQFEVLLQKQVHSCEGLIDLVLQVEGFVRVFVVLFLLVHSARRIPCLTGLTLEIQTHIKLLGKFLNHAYFILVPAIGVVYALLGERGGQK